MIQLKSYIQLFFLLLVLLKIVPVQAAEGIYSNSVRGSNINNVCLLNVEDGWYTWMVQHPNDWEDCSAASSAVRPYDRSKRFTNLSINGYVSLKWKGVTNIAFSSDWYYEVDMEVVGYSADGSWLGSSQRMLTINHKMARQQAFKDWDVLQVPGAAMLKVSLSDIRHSTDGVNFHRVTQIDVEDVELEARIVTERIYHMDVRQRPIFTLTNNWLDGSDRSATFSWQNGLYGAEEYDFEWVFIDSARGMNPVTGNRYTYQELLDWGNASRVSIRGRTYTLALPYEAGIIYFRVRGVGYGNKMKSHINSAWSRVRSFRIESGLTIEPLERGKNWSYSVNYAEEGKRVETLTLADGTGRGRQSVTKDNSKDRAIVAETVFDREGRQAVQVIPSVAAAHQNQIRFHENYNLNSGGTPINYNDFDLNNNYNTLSTPVLLSKANGASRYFSDANPDVGTTSFIPDAEQMPYTRTVFDNQGRVAEQSGVGATHRLGNGHTTKYHYATATQADLDELFGSEVGYAEHYTKQMVVDPNGQASVSYTNLSGKTVATALVAIAPEENEVDLVDELDPNVYPYSTGRIKRHDLVSSNQLESARYSASWVVRQEFLAMTAGKYDFTYTPIIGGQAPCYAPGVMEACEFELRINIYNNEGKNLASNIQNIGLLTANLNGPNLPTTGIGEFFSIQNGERLTFELEVDPDEVGTYIIVKELRLKNIQRKVETFYDNLLGYQNLYEDYIEQLYTSHQNDLINGTVTPPPTPPIHAYANCVDYSSVRPVGTWLYPCYSDTSTNPADIDQNYCETTRTILANDLLPGGQYFDNLPHANAPNYDRDAWLNAHINLSFPQYINTIPLYNWDDVRGLSMLDAREFMESATGDNLLEFHPEWCLYKDRCLDANGLTINGNSWYENLLQQNAEWVNLDGAAASSAGYLATPGSGNCYGSVSNNLISQTLSYLPTNMGTYGATLQYLMCNYVTNTNGGGNLSMADLAQLGDPNVSLGDQWTRLRGMLLDAKQKALDAHTAQVTCGSRTGYMVDADTSDQALLNSEGFEIRIASYTEAQAQLMQQSGVSLTIGSSGSALDANKLNVYVNTYRQDQAFCDYYETSAVYTCPKTTTGRNLAVAIDFGGNPDLKIHYGGSVTGFDLYQKAEHIQLCNDPVYWVNMQNDIDNAIAALAPPLNTDLQVSVRQGPTSGSIEFVFWLPGNSTPVNGTSIPYTNTQLVIASPTPPGDHTDDPNRLQVPLTYTSCEQNYPVCICEELLSLENYYTDQSQQGLLGSGIYDAMASQYNQQLNLTGSNVVHADDIRYLLKGYCGRSALNVPLNNPQLPIAIYRPTSYNDYEAWKVIFRADTVNIPSLFHTKLEDCLEPSPSTSCGEEVLQLAMHHARARLKKASLRAKEAYRRHLLTECMTTPPEVFFMEYTDHTLHHTLYYYDASGHLERTVPPTGVALLPTAQAQATQVERKQNTGNPIEPNHRLSTTYEYNTLGNVTRSTAPDRGTVRTYYDPLGRAIMTQNAQQQLDGEANYVIYDALGRITETGVSMENPNQLSFASYLTQNNGLTAAQDFQTGAFPNRLVDTTTGYGWTKKEVRQTIYNRAGFSSLFELPNTLLRNRVGSQRYLMNGVDIDYQVSYNYDVFGNAQEIWQYYPELIGNEYKQLKYDYDLISGVVHRVDYQENKRDQLSFQYRYDANNRLIEAQSSTNGYIWNSDARYEYYLHGPLKRVELGEDRVQGLDYVYTMQGWIKGVNSNRGAVAQDPGKDGVIGSLNERTAQDVFGYTVHYYDGDYQPINASMHNYAIQPTGAGNLYNGNISSVTQAQTKPAIGGAAQTALPSIWKKYRYDLLHRITRAQTEETPLGSPWNGSSFAGTTAYQTNYQYGPNGNILHLTRYGRSTTSPIDQLRYQYRGNSTPTNDPTKFANNQLLGITDVAGSSTHHNDIKTQPSTGSGNDDQNYRYDANGALIQDLSEEIATITWTSEKKLETLTRSSGSARDNLSYRYDFQGNRMSKISIPQAASQPEHHQVYVRDPQGNTLAIYEYQKDRATAAQYPPPVFLKEQLLYGSDRLGVLQRHVQTGGKVHLKGNGRQTLRTTSILSMVQGYLEYSDQTPALSYTDYDYHRDGLINSSEWVDLSILEGQALSELALAGIGTTNRSQIYPTNRLVLRKLERIRGQAQYQIANFRGDIRQVVSDVKHREDTDGDRIVDRYTANVIAVEDSYPFGWAIKERSFSTNSYRFGFNGKENDASFGDQIIQDYGFRLYNPAIAKFLSVDPLAPEYPELTPYQFASNRPIDGIDLDGLEFVGFGYLIEGLSKGAEKIGLPRASGFIQGYGQALVNDPLYITQKSAESIQTDPSVGNIIKNFDPTGITALPDFYETVKNAYGGDLKAQGQLLGLLPAFAGGFRATKQMLSSQGKVKIYRGTNRYAELHAYGETGFILSDAAIDAYMSLGDAPGKLKQALVTSHKANQQRIKEFGGLDKYVEIHGTATSFADKYGVKRTLISFTTDINKAKEFAGQHGVILEAEIPSKNVVKQTLKGSNESEVLIQNGIEAQIIDPNKK